MVEIIPSYIGNEELLKRPKVAFLAPSHVNPLSVIPTFNWLTETIKEGKVIVSGFYSPLEKDVWNLAKNSGGNLIMVLVRKPYKNLTQELRQLIKENRLLIIFLGIAPRVDRFYASIRNDYVCQISNSIVIPYLDHSSSLYPLLKKHSSSTSTKILYLPS